MPRVYISKRAEKELARLPAHVRRRFETAIDALQADEPRQVDLKPLEGTRAMWRLRVGEYRGIFEWKADGLWFTHFAHRSKMYRGF